MNRNVLLVCFLGILSLLKSVQAEPPKHEFRGAWITTHVNLDWPSSRHLTTDEKRDQLITILDTLKNVGIDAVFFQVRAESDAFYDSSYEPWSYRLTGEQGRAPGFDPLEFIIREAHSRGLELHAWLNPFRAEARKGSYPLDTTHVSAARPGWILEFSGTRTTMLDPGLPDVRAYITDIVMDIADRYDVDGIHFDDYFYPYAPAITDEDDVTFADHSRGFTNRDDWRRDNIKILMDDIYEKIIAADRNIKFGVSPFGIRLNADAGTDGNQSYTLQYADPLAWLDAGSMDYLLPQIYWETGHPAAAFEKLQPWWAEEIALRDRHYYVGHAPYKMTDSNDWPSTQLGKQIRMNRAKPELIHGSSYFRTSHLTSQIKGFTDTLKTNYYAHPAIIPVMPWKETSQPPPVTRLSYHRTDPAILELTWETPPTEEGQSEPRRYAVYRFTGEKAPNLPTKLQNPHNLLAITGQPTFTDHNAPDNTAYYYVITTLSRNNVESEESLIYILPVKRAEL